MLTEVIVWILTALAVVVVVVSRLRVRPGADVGGRPVSAATLNAHTAAGLAAVLVWAVFLLGGPDSWMGSALTGIIAIGLWWITAALGIVLLLRWRRSRGRHSGDDVEHVPTGALALSVLGHVGLLLGVLWFTWLYLVSAV